LKLDRCLMAHGVEGRTPFLDPEVARFAFHLPDAMKVHDGLGKWLMRRGMERRCPPAAPYAEEYGFTRPVQAWMAGRKKAPAELVSQAPGVEEFCRPSAVRRLFMGCENKSLGLAAWTLLFYAIWHSIHLCGSGAEGDGLDLLQAA